MTESTFLKLIEMKDNGLQNNFRLDIFLMKLMQKTQIYSIDIDHVNTKDFHSRL